MSKSQEGRESLGGLAHDKTQLPWILPLFRTTRCRRNCSACFDREEPRLLAGPKIGALPTVRVGTGELVAVVDASTRAIVVVWCIP